MKKAAFLSIGCKTNQYETEALKEEILLLGYESAEQGEAADVYIVNTCAVTAEAVRKSKQMIRRAQGRDAVICVMGCYSELDPDDVMGMKDVFFVTGTSARRDIVRFLREGAAGKENAPDNEYEPLALSSFSEKTRAYIKIEDGCDNYCSYCVIPFARGGVRSRAFEEISSEARRLASAGFAEIVITGTNICKYDSGGKTLTDVIREIAAAEGVSRVRLGSVYPDYLTEDRCKELLSIEKLCPHFHISLQSASDRVLGAMNRSYTGDQAYVNLSKLSAMDNEILFTADVIVGFPGEEEEDFSKTQSFISSLPFYHTHVFRFSAREGTKAASMGGQVSRRISEERSKKLILLSESRKKSIIESYTGRTVSCLFEGGNDDNSGDLTGRAANYMEIVCAGSGITGKPQEVVIRGYENGRARAEIRNEGKKGNI